MRNAQQPQQHHRQPAVAPHNCPADVQRRDLFVFLRRSMRFTAMYPLPLVRLFPRSLRPLATLLDVTYECFMYLVLIHIGVLYCCTLYMNLGKGDLELLVTCGVQMNIFAWGLLTKIFFKRIHPKRVDALMLYINSEYRTRSANGFTWVSMDGSLALSKKAAKAFLFSCYAGVTFWLVLPIVYQDRSLPLPCWYPVDYTAPFVYEIIYLLQVIAQFQLATTFSSTGNFYVVVSVLFSGQFDVLNCSLKNVVATAYISMRVPQAQLLALKERQQISDAELNQYYCAVEQQIDMQCIDHLMDERSAQPENFRAAFKLALTQCIIHHRYILNGLDQLEELYHFIWFFKTFQITILMCLVMFAAVKSTSANTLLKLVSLGQYFVLVLWDLLNICYSGEIVFENSQRCDEALLRSPWYLHMTEIKSDQLLFLINAQRPYRLTAGKLYNWNLSRFRSCLTSAFSFFTILQKMDQRDQK